MNVVCLGIFSVIIVRNNWYPDMQEIVSYHYALSMYYIVDTACLLKWPECSPAPKETLLHHFLTIILCCLTVVIPEGRMIALRAELIEPSTCLSYLRRLLKSKRFFYLDAIFYVSLILIRHVWFPYLGYGLYLRFSEGNYIKVYFAGILYLNLTYVWWTITLLKIQRRKYHSLSAKDRNL